MIARLGEARATRPEPAPRLLRNRLLRGANIHHRSTVFAQRFDPGALSGLRAVDVGADFAKRFAERFGGLESLQPGGCLPQATHTALAGTPGPFLTELALEAILALERFVAGQMCRLDVPRFSRVVTRGGVVELVWESHSAGVSRAAAQVAFAGLIELLPADLGGAVDRDRDFETLLAKLRRRYRRRRWSPTTAVLALAAKQRGLPHELLAGNYLRVGQGAMQHVISEAALDIAPVAETRRVDQGSEASAVPGRARLYRLLVVDGKLVSALRCDPPVITGDGTSTIAQLIDRLNRDPSRNNLALRTVSLDERLRSDLARVERGLHHVPWTGERIVLPGVMSFERGATLVDVTPHVHESIRDMVVLAAVERARTMVCVEVLTANIAQSCRHGAARVVSTKPADLFVHALLGLDRANAVGDAVLDVIFPEGVPATVPTALVVGERGTRAIAHDLDRLLRTSRQGVGLATSDQTTIQGRPVDRTSLGRRGGPAFLLGDPRVHTVVSAVSPRKIVERGLRLDRSSVTTILDPAPEGDLEVYRAGVTVALAATTDAIVIGVENPFTPFVMDSVDAARVFLVTKRRSHPLAVHLAAKGNVVLFGADPSASIDLRSGGGTIASGPFPSRTAGSAFRSGRTRKRALYTAGTAWALGMSTGQGSGRSSNASPTRSAPNRESVRMLTG